MTLARWRRRGGAAIALLGVVAVPPAQWPPLPALKPPTDAYTTCFAQPSEGEDVRRTPRAVCLMVVDDAINGVRSVGVLGAGDLY